MKKKINNRAGSKKQKNKKHLKKKAPKQIIIAEKNSADKEGVEFTNWTTLLNENSGLL